MVHVDCQLDKSRITWKTNLWCVCESIYIRLIGESPTTYVGGAIPWTKYKGKDELSPSIHLSLLPDSGCHVTSCITLLLPRLPHHDRPCPQAGRQIDPSLRCFVSYSVTEMKKVTSTVLTFLRAVVGIWLACVPQGLCVLEAWCPVCWCELDLLEEGLSAHGSLAVSLGEETDPSSTVLFLARCYYNTTFHAMMSWEPLPSIQINVIPPSWVISIPSYDFWGNLYTFYPSIFR